MTKNINIKSKIKQKIGHIWGLSNSYNRDEFVENWFLSLEKGSSILDAGAGPQRYKKYAKHLKYTSQDFGEYEGGEQFGKLKVDNWNSKTCDIICDITNIPRSDCSFDYVFCTEVFEHLPNPIEALQELTRILKINGEMVITAPYRCLYHQDPYFFYSGFSKYWYQYFAKENNLEIKYIKKNGNYFQDIAQEVSRISTFGSLPQRVLNLIFTIPFFCYLFYLDKIAKTTSPESCWGYHVIFRKKS